MLGTMPEMLEDILKRVTNDKTSPDYNSNQLQGAYYYAPTAADVAPAYESIQERDHSPEQVSRCLSDHKGRA